MNFDLNKTPDFWSRYKIESKQLKLLKKQLKYIKNQSPFYKSKLINFDLNEIKSLSDLKKLPLTHKLDLSTENERFLAVKPHKIVEYVTTSGTTSDPIVISLTKNDLRRLAYNEARALKIADYSKKDIAQITTTLDRRFMAGMAYYLGLQKIGSAVVRTGNDSAIFQWNTINQLQPTAIIGVPSYLEKLGKMNPTAGSSSSIEKMLCIGEPIRHGNFKKNKLYDNLSKVWDVDIRSTYASTEMATAFTDCSAKKGGHLLPELLVMEVLDHNGNEVQDGVVGEVVVTPLGIEGIPLLRFKTGDLARKYSEICDCGRTTTRLGPIEGRVEHMLKVKGTTIFTQQIEAIIQEKTALELYVIVLETDENNLDSISIMIDEKNDLEIQNSLSMILQAALRVKPTIIPINSAELKSIMFPEGARKPMKILNKRNGQA